MRRPVCRRREPSEEQCRFIEALTPKAGKIMAQYHTILYHTIKYIILYHTIIYYTVIYHIIYHIRILMKRARKAFVLAVQGAKELCRLRSILSTVSGSDPACLKGTPSKLVVKMSIAQDSLTDRGPYLKPWLTACGSF